MSLVLMQETPKSWHLQLMIVPETGKSSPTFRKLDHHHAKLCYIPRISSKGKYHRREIFFCTSIYPFHEKHSTGTRGRKFSIPIFKAVDSRS